MDPLVTVDELSAYLQRTVPAETGALAVAGASGAVRAHCGWDIAYEDGVQFELDGSGSRVLNLPTLHLIAVYAVYVNGEELDPDGYRWARRGQLYRDTPWPRWQGVVADCEHGYAAIPDVVKIVTLGQAARYLANPEALKIAAVGSVQRTYADLTSLDLALLDQYRLP